jgi:excinuclease UvrABC nuclease subunit
MSLSRLIYRPVADRDGFLDWVEDLEGRSGVYVIRRYESREVLYIGESHTGRLRNTLKRHFWAWKDSPQRIHNSYSRATCEAAVRLSAPSRATAYQNALIRRLNPRDNVNGYGGEEAPF